MSVTPAPVIDRPTCNPTCTYHQDHRNDHSCSKCSNFYNRYVKLSESQINILTETTETQARGTNTDIWKDSRKIRITGSTAHKVPVRDTTNPDNFIREQLYPTFVGNRFTEHGNSGEIKAKAMLRENGMDISDSGTVVSSSNPWLSVSPDGIINMNSENVLLEIKCPIVETDSLQTYFASGKYDVVRVDDTNRLKPKGPRGYYLQVQLTLHVCNLRKCYFLVWTPAEYQTVEVIYDEVFCDREITRLKNFYFQKFLPRIVDEYESTRFSLSEKYKDLVV